MARYVNKPLLRGTPPDDLFFSPRCCASTFKKRALLSYLLAPFLLFSLSSTAKSAENESTESPTSANRPLKSKQEREASLLKDVARSLDNKTSGITSNGASAIWLNADNQDFLGIYTPAATAEASGTVLILHDEGEHPLWPGAIVNLQNYLPEKGWATFSIALPDQIYPDPPPRPTEEELAKHTSTSTEGSAKSSGEIDPTINDSKTNQQEQEYNSQSGKQEIENQAQNRIIAAIKHINENEKNGIALYGQGLSGLRAAVYLKTLNESGGSSANTVNTLIIVDSPNEIYLIEKDNQKASIKTIYDSFTSQEFPILDIISNSSSQNIQQAKRRKIEAKRRGLKKYRQYSVTDPNGGIFLTSIYGFLKTNGE